MNYWNLYYHIVWTTKNHLPLITNELKEDLYKYINNKGVSKEGAVYAVGGYIEHIHVVVSIPPKISVSEYVSFLKGASSHWVNKIRGNDDYFQWQRGYGVFSFHESILNKIVTYVLNQEEHHTNGTTKAKFETTNVESD